MSVQRTLENQQLHPVSALFEPERFAAEFNAQAHKDVAAALSLWDSAVRVLPEDLRTVLGRFLEARLDEAARLRLIQHPTGGALLFSWGLEKNRRPAMPPLPFFSPRLAWFHFADMVAQYGSGPAQAALARGEAMLLLLQRAHDIHVPPELPRQDDQLAVLQGGGAEPDHRQARSFAIGSRSEWCTSWEGSLVLTLQPASAKGPASFIGHTDPGPSPDGNAIPRAVCLHGGAAAGSPALVDANAQHHALGERSMAELRALLGRQEQVCCMVLTMR